MTKTIEGKKAREANWANPVSKLSVDNVPKEAMNLNVAGRQLTGPIKGFGQMWQKTYKIRLIGASASPTEVIASWKENFPDFWPRGNHFYGPLTGIAPGEVAVLNLSAAGMPLSTGIMVIYADDESFGVEAPQVVSGDDKKKKKKARSSRSLERRRVQPCGDLGFLVASFGRPFGDLFWWRRPQEDPRFPVW